MSWHERANDEQNDLSVTIAGSGDVHYYGDPKVSRSVIGSGSIQRLGGAPL